VNASPDRRDTDLVDFVPGGRRWTTCDGRFDDGRLGEIFIE